MSSTTLIMVFILCCGFSCSYAVQSDLDCFVSHNTFIQYLLILPVLLFSTIFMPIRIFANETLKYWHLHTNILVIFNLLLFIVVIIELVTLEQLYLTMTLFVFVQQFLIFVYIVVQVIHKFWLFMNLLVFLYQHDIFESEVTFEILSFKL